MAIQTACDRCKIIIETSSGSELLLFKNPLCENLKRTPEGLIMPITSAAVDLCGDCKRSLENWIKYPR